MKQGPLGNYFGFNRQQRNGLFVLMCISLALLLVRMGYPYLMPPGNTDVENLPLISRKLDSAGREKKSFKKYKEADRAKLFYFDPNLVSESELKQLGFSERQAASFIKFRNRGSGFHSATDLRKVYVINDKLFDRIAPYVRISEPAVKKNAQPEKASQSAQPSIQLVDINLADTAELESLPGIGASYAKRICKYRSLLGGYYAIEQLREVYGFNEELFSRIKDRVKVSGELKQLDLNKDEFKSISRHPYIGYEKTKELFSFRKKQRITAENLAQLFDEENQRKLLPYLRFD